MGTSITCPNCRHQFVMEDAFAADIEKEMRGKMETEWRKRVDALQSEKQQLEKARLQVEQQKQSQQEELNKLLASEKQRLQETLSENIRKSVAANYENQLQMLQQTAQDQEEKLRKAQQQELEFLRKAQELKDKEQELDLTLEKKLIERSQQLAEQIRKDEAQRNQLKETDYQLKLRELEKQLEDQRKLAEEMKRRAEQGSTQLQGEIQELVLEELLRGAFPFDEITEVGKGVRGADCIQIIRNQFGQECGKIIYESKRTKDFSRDWVEKLKADMRSQGADIAILVTQAMPKDMERFGDREGVWICSFAEVKALAHVLRDGVIKISTALKTQENRGDKMHMLYGYLTSGEFAEQWKAIREGFMAMKISLQKERDAMEKIWKAREKHLEKVLLNAAHIKGSIEGIAGSDSVDLKLLEDAADTLLE
ncbi:DUF2130 domain-containing protein [Chitinophaga tropicalis]|uniref:DUF2130 domain-containing protein n=1 Tax=Chitinophaga tropicalis TaxID=2683588 RepID=A0A7K1UE42_9BACT|nr:DUF2130 domain-containing protein [Chitinophaga tropicalis]MVT12586.1 DUF2130 domain-containing protein [Chitinophaga tropicalis]